MAREYTNQSGLVQYYVCPDCSTVVKDKTVHDNWHTWMMNNMTTRPAW